MTPKTLQALDRRSQHFLEELTEPMGRRERRHWARARALILILNYNGLRIGDALIVSRDPVQSGEILIYTQRAETPVWIPLHPEVERALELLPLPRGAEAGCRYFFWNGRMGRRALLGIAERTLHRVVQLSGVAHAPAHRLRHSLAIDILTTGGTLADVATALDNTEAIVARHYALCPVVHSTPGADTRSHRSGFWQGGGVTAQSRGPKGGF
ncbi:MAG: hypothetical protein A3J28_10830 [Acidobacteria bacterium RIFCSPLOWO2_12_FULL_60_22]|nr:MAG: hypothetical protein A3J28_10830 [Acidobacteria bacterium RIFCSPLOWO2_12_FULL_60_22]